MRLVALQHREPTTMLAGLDAVWEAGAAALPLDPAAPDEHVRALLARLRPAELRTDRGTTSLEDTARATDRSAAPVPDGTALVVTTSGSTGPPAGIVLSHRALATATRLTRTSLGAPDDVPWLGVLPLHHVAGISTVLRSRAAGREPTLHDRVTPELLTATEPSWMSLVPTQLRRLLDERADLARHHGVLVGGGPVPDRLLADAAAAGVHVVTSYGATETCGGVVHDARPLQGVEVATTTDGLLRLRTPTLADGVRRPDGAVAPLVDPDGWWTTSDRGAVRADGTVEVHGRADDVVVSGGENVALGPVRSALAAALPERPTAVVGLPSDRWGTAVTAVVAGADRDGAPGLADLRATLGDRLPRHHLPTALVLTEDLPTGGVGKVTAASVLAALEKGTAALVDGSSPDVR